MQIWQKNNVKFAREPHKVHKMPKNAKNMPINAIVFQTINLENYRVFFFTGPPLSARPIGNSDTWNFLMGFTM